MKRALILRSAFCLGLAAALAVSAPGCGGWSEIETIDGHKVVHNRKTPAGRADRNLAWREDLVIGGETLAEEYLFVLPTEIIADEAGNIYVLDSRDCTVKKFDPHGKFVARFGRKGQGPGEFESPVGVCFDEDGRLLVGDRMGRIALFDASGAHLNSLKTDRFYRFEAAPGGGFVFEYEINVEEANGVQRIRRIVAEKAGGPPVALYERAQLPFGAIQNKDFRFEIPLFLRWDIAPGGRLRVGTANRYEVREIAMDGQVAVAFTMDHEPLPVPSIIQSTALEQLAGSKLPMMAIDPRDIEEHLKHYPVFKSITADEKERTWVELFRPDRQDRPQTETLFRVFSADGFFLFTTRIEADLAARPFFKNGSLYALRRDAKGYIEAVRFTLPDGL
jgi:hypothetical protein